MLPPVGCGAAAPLPLCHPQTCACLLLQQLLWKLGGSSVQPGMVVKAFCQQQHIQQPQQLEREVQ